MAPAPEGSKPSANTRSAEVNEEESDSDFDDVEVDFSHHLADSSAAPGTDALKDLGEKFYAKYGLGATDDTATIFEVNRLEENVAAKAQALEADPKSATAKKEYKEALQRYLDTRAGLITMINNKYLINGADISNDIKLPGDPLLTPSELVQINASIVAIDKHGEKVVYRPRSGTFRKRRPTHAELEKLAAAELQKDPIKNLPAGWKQISPYQNAKDTLNKELSRIFGSVKTSDDISSLPLKERHAAQLLATMQMASVLNKTTGQVDIRARIVDTTGNYKGSVLVATRQRDGSGPRVASDEEIAHVLNVASDLASRVVMPDSGDYSKPEAGIPDNVSTDIFITQSGQEHSIHEAFNGSDTDAIAYANPLTGVTLFMDRARGIQNRVDETGSDKTRRFEDMAWWSTTLKPDTLDALSHTVVHEFGHIVQFAYISDSTLKRPWKIHTRYTDKKTGQLVEVFDKPDSIESISQYGNRNPYEHFAESFAKYMITGEATPEFMQIMRSLGILKSQRNN